MNPWVITASIPLYASSMIPGTRATISSTTGSPLRYSSLVIIILRASMKLVLMPLAFITKQMIVEDRSSPFDMIMALFLSESSLTAHTAFTRPSSESQIAFTRLTALSLRAGLCSRSSDARFTWRLLSSAIRVFVSFTFPAAAASEIL